MVIKENRNKISNKLKILKNTKMIIKKKIKIIFAKFLAWQLNLNYLAI